MRLQQWMQRAINRALSGDKEALDLLDVVDEKVVPAIRAITPRTLQAEYKYACRQYLAAMHLQVKGMERIARKYLRKNQPYQPVSLAHQRLDHRNHPNVPTTKSSAVKVHIPRNNLNRPRPSCFVARDVLVITSCHLISLLFVCSLSGRFVQLSRLFRL